MGSASVSLPAIPVFDDEAASAAQARQEALAKPPGSLGRLEDLAVALAGLVGTSRPRISSPTVVVAAADHGVVDRGVSAYPSDVTRAMLGAFAREEAAVSAIADVVGADVVVVDAGVDGDPVGSAEGAAPVIDERIGCGTADLAAGPAMTRNDAVAALNAGVRTARIQLADADLVALGEMGIGNTTAAAAVTASVTGADPARVTGHGTGIDEDGRAHKVAIVERALNRADLAAPDTLDPVEVLRQVGGYEMGLLAGVALGCAADRTPVVVDGVVSGAAALLADALDGGVRPYLLPSHAGTEPAHAIQRATLDLEPLFDHGLRLGEGTGAALAIATYRAACATHNRMATLADLAVDG